MIETARTEWPREGAKNCKVEGVHLGHADLSRVQITNASMVDANLFDARTIRTILLSLLRLVAARILCSVVGSETELAVAGAVC